MKRFWLCSLMVLVLFGRLAAQDSLSGSFHLTSIPEKGLVLNTGWTFMPGDNPSWSQPGFADSEWKPVDPTEEVHHLPQVREAGIGWFRLKMEVDPHLRGKSIGMLMSGFGAMEIYLNGKLTYQFGQPARDYEKETTRFFTTNLLSITFDTMAEQVIAVRYSFNKQNLYVKFATKRPILKIELKEINQGITENLKENNFESSLRTIQVSFYLPLGFLLLFLFMSFRPQREYLFAGVFCLSLFLAVLFHILALSEPVTVNHSNSFLLITQVLYIIGAISFIHSLYLLYKRKRSFYFYLIVVYGVLSIPFYFISYDLSGFVNAFFFPVIDLEFLRLNIHAVYHRRKGAWILLITSIVFALTIVTYIYFALINYNNAAALFQGISFIIPGLGLSIFYAGEFARTASAERQRTVEVQRLSHEMIENEKEKQQILTDQNVTLERQVKERTAELERSLMELKEAEEQLIQREKMASLGELTAGIAHEIQNPLNFVNNFSEVNKELIEELKIQNEKLNNEEIDHLLDNLAANSEKITHHGRRADSIVKSMLEHSRSGKGEKQQTDINALCDEYLRLAYHGFRAQHKNFNAAIQTDFDDSIGRIDIVPQDIGRVLLNLFNNALYACAEQSRRAGDLRSTGVTEGKPGRNETGYEACVVVRTKKLSHKIEIRIIDNGKGIPGSIKDKIFQPFFTTKPTGQGTGLGLSLAYDIIKAHGGEIEVKTNEDEGSIFIIQLPFREK